MVGESIIDPVSARHCHVSNGHDSGSEFHSTLLSSSTSTVNDDMKRTLTISAVESNMIGLGEKSERSLRTLRAGAHRHGSQARMRQYFVHDE